VSHSLLQCRNLDVAIGDLLLVAKLNLDVHAGELVCIIGCNGAGKSTLMHTLAGLNDVAGDLELMQTPLTSLSRIDVARNVALLAQQQEDAFPATVRETVLLGRHPHLGFWEWETAKDQQIAMESLSSLSLAGLAERDIGTLSGGERQRVALATVLTQQPSLYLLDEPLNNLDPKHQLSVIKRFRDLSTQGAATIAILHDLNLVSRFADRVLLLYGPKENGHWQFGTLDGCLTTENLTRLYQTPIQRFTYDSHTFFVQT